MRVRLRIDELGIAGQRRSPDLRGEQPLDAARQLRVAARDRRVRHAQAARHQRVGHLCGRHLHVALGALEPFEAGLRGGLQRLDFGAAARLVRGERGADVARGEQLVAQDDHVLHRELGSRADREVGGVGGITEQDHERCRSCVRAPLAAPHGREVAPDRSVLDQLVIAEVILEDLAEDREAC